ncbi:hypothetical protein [Paenibacillus polymyxa]|uniref:hypothetical protein n=4 Tax=Paenibacillus polymyxa TaxID=1406 RepID=UPI0008BE0559|nr:hypothetical protein [Paenibacillus polymyxa]MCJ1220272.1 hypothetical protein [Paenibacillus polymyxa]MEB4782807.1 hypothetical protein [Paenibacillus jamilae]SEJ56692.1 hypothetical protein SAMN04488600_103299 [Paenibacillus polymyxa]
MEERIKETLKKINSKITFDIDIESEIVVITDPRWPDEIEFSFDSSNLDAFFDEVKVFLYSKYIPITGCYREDYFEVLVDIKDLILGNGLEEVELSGMQSDGQKIYYEISAYSGEIRKLINLNQNYRELLEEDWYSSLKIYNLNTNLNFDIDDPNAIESMMFIAKSVLFELSYKYSVELRIIELPESDENNADDIVYEQTEALNSISNTVVKVTYDSEMLNYYYRAMIMDNNEFKYLAFYQILECIFDEVYQYELVQDVKQILNSNWFSTHNEEHISKMIRLVEQYNNKKTDVEKLRMVLERYFKGDIHDNAFILVNNEVINELKSLHIISKEEEIKNISVIAKHLFDFRCECTHSNRKFPTKNKVSFDKTKSELDSYIQLIKMISSRVICNYKVKEL